VEKTFPWFTFLLNWGKKMPFLNKQSLKQNTILLFCSRLDQDTHANKKNKRHDTWKFQCSWKFAFKRQHVQQLTCLRLHQTFLLLRYCHMCFLNTNHSIHWTLNSCHSSPCCRQDTDKLVFIILRSTRLM